MSKQTPRTRKASAIRARKAERRKTAKRRAKPSGDWRKSIDWVAAGRKAYETKMRNLGKKPAATKAAAKPVTLRVDADAAAYEARVLAAIARTTPKDKAEKAGAVIGQDFGGGWVIVATDGIRALTKKGIEATGATQHPALTADPLPYGIDITPELGDALKQLQVATRGTLEKKQRAIVTIAIDGRRREVALTVGKEKRIVKAVGGKLKTATLRADLLLLLDGLGRGGRLGFTTDPNKPLNIDTSDGLRYVLMGVRP